MEIPETDSEDEMAPGWEERCTADGLVFYAHHSSRTTQWHHPRTNKRKRVTGELPFGWERQITEEGKVFFVDHINHKTTYTDPRLAFAVEESKSLTDLRQRFDSSTTGIQVLHGRDLTGHVAIVTGANCGIGYETARSLAYHGCTVVFACRDLGKAEAAIAQLKKQRPSSSCHALQVDLASLTSVRIFAHTFSVRFERCDILVLNAGVFGLPHTLTEDGLETIFQVNHLSHFYLTLLLQPLLVRSVPSRVVFVSCEAHRFSALDTENISEELVSPSHKSTFTSIMAYCNSKLCNVLTALEMQRRFGEQGINFYAVHPGNAVSTYLTRHRWAYRLLYALIRPFTKSLYGMVKYLLYWMTNILDEDARGMTWDWIQWNYFVCEWRLWSHVMKQLDVQREKQQACATSVYCAASVDVSRYGGIYVNNCVPCLPSKASLNSVLSNRLWVISLSVIEHVLGRRAFNMQPLSENSEVPKY